MAGQGSTTKRIASLLSGSGWTVIYTCIPNTSHDGVIPIPTPYGTSHQRYPDIVACKDNITRLVEVEMRLDEAVAAGIYTRFGEMVLALQDGNAWVRWRNHVHNATGHWLPEIFTPRCDLVICGSLNFQHQPMIRVLLSSSIYVSAADKYSP
jgi:hypothetical protein